MIALVMAQYFKPAVQLGQILVEHAAALVLVRAAVVPLLRGFAK